MINRLIYNFVFENERRDDIFLSNTDKIRLNTEDTEHPALMLKATGGKYPTDDDIYASTYEVEPHAVRKWLAVEVVGTKPENTDWFLRLDNGVEKYFHNGSNWAIAGVNDWNTEDEINQHLEEFELCDNTFKIKLQIKLKTSNETTTPTVQQIKLLGRYDINWKDDLIFDTIVQDFRENLRYVLKLGIVTDQPTTEIDLLNEFKPENDGYNMDTCESVYDITVDPLRQVNLLQSYSRGPQRRDGTYDNGTITLTTEVPSGHDVDIKMKCEPEVAVNTSQDYHEVAKFPVVVIERIEYNRIIERSGQEQDSVKNKTAGTAVLLESPAQYSVRFEYVCLTTRQVDLQNLAEEVERYLKTKLHFTSWGTGEKYFVQPMARLFFDQKPDLDDTNSSIGVFEVSNVVFYLKESEDVPLVLRLNSETTTE